MKLKFVLLLLLICCANLHSQNLKEVDQYVIHHLLKEKNIDKLSNKINAKYQKPIVRARAIYCYISSTISYDVDAWKKGNVGYRFTYKTEKEKEQKLRAFRNDKAIEAVKSGKAVCDGYSTLFEILCHKSEIECITVQGESKSFLSDLNKTFSEDVKGDHAWNIITINGEKFLVDTTWGAGSIDNQLKFVKNYSDVYFMMPPNRFILNHYPQQEQYKLTSISKKQFYDYPLFYLDYFFTNIKLIAPLNKEIKKSNSFQIILSPLTIQKDLLFAYDDSKYALDIKMKEIDGKLYIEVPSSSPNSTYFTIYYKNMSIVTYLVK
ncbi:transglutaminase domain-containing protein [Flammeovirga pacifica]|uniref:Transglutaminase-like domain-containing protein n=1 Tax=Flammeovirga pacifica TaxID=915059 RepID=A0A1S1YSU6_FLAPC|nr:transglutaminase-like domain-containing protein [Flammeovirga pacifica]OHX64104.1 hypothetical protein NH26_21090 [Flammeovirga pacifica]